MAMLDLLIRDAWIIDGTGAPGFRGCVGVEGDRIAFVTNGACQRAAAEVVEGKGLVCSPGFIDAHSHGDISFYYYPDCFNAISQGITTFVGGNCGIGLAPALRPDFYESYHRSLDVGSMPVCWKTFGQWLDFVGTLPLAANFVPLVPLNPLRGSVLGRDYQRPSTADEIQRELYLLDEALDAGAFGFSLSLDPGIAGHFADRRELDCLFSRLQEREVLLTAHTRHHQTQWPSDDGRTFYGWFIGHKGEVMCGRYQGLVEFMEYYRRFPGLRTMIAHLTNAFVVPQPHSLALEHAMMDETMELLVDQPNRDGCDVYCNVIPDQQSISSAYRVATPMVRNMPFEDTVKDYASEEKMIAGLRDRAFRQKMKAFINGGKFKLTMLHPATDPYWADAYQIVESTDRDAVGKTLLQLTRERMPGTHMEMIYNNCLEVLFDLLLADPMVQGAMILDKREFATERFLKNPRCMPITDSVMLPPVPDTARNIMGYGTPPVAYTSMVRFLVNLCREGGVLGMEEAFRRLTSLPAHVLRLRDRGILRSGYFADITMLDWRELGYVNDFMRPAQTARGIRHVIVNGRFALRDGRVVAGPAGRVLRR